MTVSVEQTWVADDLAGTEKHKHCLLAPRQHVNLATQMGMAFDPGTIHAALGCGLRMATLKASTGEYLHSQWAEQKERFIKVVGVPMLEEEAAIKSQKRWRTRKQLVVLFGNAGIGTRGGWGAKAVRQACHKMIAWQRVAAMAVAAVTESNRRTAELRERLGQKLKRRGWLCLLESWNLDKGGGEEDEFWKLISSAQVAILPYQLHILPLQLHARSPPPTTGSAVVHADAHHQLQPALAFRVHHQPAKPSNRCSSTPWLTLPGVVRPFVKAGVGWIAELPLAAAAGLRDGRLWATTLTTGLFPLETGSPEHPKSRRELERLPSPIRLHAHETRICEMYAFNDRRRREAEAELMIMIAVAQLEEEEAEEEARTDVKVAVMVFMCCCILHNICIDHGEAVPEGVDPDAIQDYEARLAEDGAGVDPFPEEEKALGGRARPADLVQGERIREALVMLAEQR
ncbi:hypothetical protein QJQ45_005670 [Haematococcus lacustris]|nr:hypothetical protein QJQ45_005670 [Haematococcus lacustris]